MKDKLPAVQFSPAELDLLGMLRKGSANAVTGRELAAYMGTDKRTIQDMINGLRRKFVPIIGSSNTKAAGYYIASTSEDIDRFILQQEHRRAEIAQTVVYLEITRAKLYGA